MIVGRAVIMKSEKDFKRGDIVYLDDCGILHNKDGRGRKDMGCILSKHKEGILMQKNKKNVYSMQLRNYPDNCYHL